MIDGLINRFSFKIFAIPFVGIFNTVSGLFFYFIFSDVFGIADSYSIIFQWIISVLLAYTIYAKVLDFNLRDLGGLAKFIIFNVIILIINQLYLISILTMGSEYRFFHQLFFVVLIRVPGLLLFFKKNWVL